MNEPPRPQLATLFPEAYGHLIALHRTIQQGATDAGLDQKLIELVKIRASQINGCAFCTDMHCTDARRHGERERRIFCLPVWRETTMFSAAERAALELTEAMTLLPETQDVSDEVYEQARAAFDERQYAVVAWAITAINAFNRLGVTGRKPLPE